MVIEAAMDIHDSGEMADIVVDFLQESINIVEEMYSDSLSSDIWARKAGILSEEDKEEKGEEGAGEDENKNKGFFRRVWEAIKKAISKIGEFFKGLFTKSEAGEKKMEEMIEENAGTIDKGVKAGVSISLPSKITTVVMAAIPDKHGDLNTKIAKYAAKNMLSERKSKSKVDFVKDIRDAVLGGAEGWKEYYDNLLGEPASDTKITSAMKEWAVKSHRTSIATRKTIKWLNRKEAALSIMTRTPRFLKKKATINRMVYVTQFITQGWNALKSVIQKIRGYARGILSALRKAGAAEKSDKE